MPENEIGYYEDPANGNDIQRARTTMQVRSWDIRRQERTLNALKKELETVEYPAIYILFEKAKKAYVGEAQNIHTRITQHMKTPDPDVRNWDRALIISDGRPATQSDFNDTVVRRALESYLIKLLKTNNYTVVSQGQTTGLNQTQRHTVDALTAELNFFLAKKNVIFRLLDEGGQEEVFPDDLRKLFASKDIVAQHWSTKEAVIKGQKAFIRPGSKKPRGWQITSRGRKPGSFIDCLQKGEGYLLVPRDGVLLIPLSEVRKVIESGAFKQDTVDVFIAFLPEKALLKYKNNVLDVTAYKLTK